jgi:lipoprotein NlpD
MITFYSSRIVFTVISMLMLLTACQSSDVGAPVRNAGESGKYHRVQKGDTLYSIAWRYGKDYKSLAKANKIAHPYTIYLGQKIVIRGRSAESKQKPASKRKTSKSKSAAKSTTTQSSSSAIVWRWPLNGNVLKEFSLNGKVNKGIDIAGSAGKRVNAAADGVVVYAGGNLRGYGKLVILKHDDHFLSAYGNNRSIRVKEGQRVNQGQALAEVGTSSSDIEMLHFEIRKDGKPENPISYLPRK